MKARRKGLVAVGSIVAGVALLGTAAIAATTMTTTNLALNQTNVNKCSTAASSAGGQLSFSGNKSQVNVTCSTASTTTTSGSTTTTTVAPTTSTTVGPTTTVAPTTTTVPVGGTCTNPVYTTSDATGTINLDPSPQPEYWWVDNDAWNGGHGPQTLSVCSISSWTAASNQPNQQGQVEAYPNTEYDVGGRANGVSTKSIASYNSITSTYAITLPAAGSWDAAYDMWTNNWGHETMIWTKDQGTQEYWNTQGTLVTIAGVQYQFINLGNEDIFIMNPTGGQTDSGSVNILAVYQYEVAQGIAQASDPITQLEYGVEVCSTTGTEDFSLTGLTFNLS